MTSLPVEDPLFRGTDWSLNYQDFVHAFSVAIRFLSYQFELLSGFCPSSLDYCHFPLR